LFSRRFFVAWGRAVAALMALSAVSAAALQAQTSSQPPLRRVEAAAAGTWLGGGALAGADANLRTRDGTDYRLFGTDSRFEGTPAIEARVAYALTRRYTVESRFGFSRPELRSSISDDVEGAPAITVAETLDQYVVEGALLVMLDRLRFASLVPFGSGGAGYLRQLHEGQTLVEEGIVYHVGGGVRRQLFGRSSGFLKGAGFRGDGRVYVVTGGVEFDEGARTQVALSAGVFVNF
jgi:hypothetical protein